MLAAFGDQFVPPLGRSTGREDEQGMSDQEDTAINESPARKSMGAYIVAVAVGLTAAFAPLHGWQALAVGAAIWWGLHMVAGLNIKWRYRW